MLPPRRHFDALAPFQQSTVLPSRTAGKVSYPETMDVGPDQLRRFVANLRRAQEVCTKISPISGALAVALLDRRGAVIDRIVQIVESSVSYDDKLGYLANQYAGATRLEAAGCAWMTTSRLETLMANFVCLKQLNLTSNYRIEDRDIMLIGDAPCAKTLERIVLNNCGAVTGAGVKMLANAIMRAPGRRRELRLHINAVNTQCNADDEADVWRSNNAVTLNCHNETEWDSSMWRGAA
jgi:hypothetical protein